MLATARRRVDVRQHLVSTGYPSVRSSQYRRHRSKLFVIGMVLNPPHARGCLRALLFALAKRNQQHFKHKRRLRRVHLGPCTPIIPEHVDQYSDERRVKCCGCTLSLRRQIGVDMEHALSLIYVISTSTRLEPSFWLGWQCSSGSSCCVGDFVAQPFPTSKMRRCADAKAKLIGALGRIQKSHAV